jgi:hypothetical protein
MIWVNVFQGRPQQLKTNRGRQDKFLIIRNKLSKKSCFCPEIQEYFHILSKRLAHNSNAFHPIVAIIVYKDSKNL